MNESIYETINRIANETIFSYGQVEEVYLATGSVKDTLYILETSVCTGISVHHLIPPIMYDKTQTLMEVMKEEYKLKNRIKRFFKKVFKFIKRKKEK